MLFNIARFKKLIPLPAAAVAILSIASAQAAPVGNQCDDAFFNLSRVGSPAHGLEICCEKTVTDVSILKCEAADEIAVITAESCAYDIHFFQAKVGQILRCVVPGPLPTVSPDPSPGPAPSAVPSSTPSIVPRPTPSSISSSTPSRTPPSPSPLVSPSPRPTVKAGALTDLEWKDPCWSGNKVPNSTGAFMRMTTSALAGVDSLKSCVTLEDLGSAEPDLIEPHAYGGFEFKIDGVTYVIDMGLEGQSGLPWQGKIGRNSSGLVPFLRISIPAHRPMKFVSLTGNDLETLRIKSNGLKAELFGANGELSPVRFHRGDRVCMELSLSETTYQGQQAAGYRLSFDPDHTIKNQPNINGTYVDQTLREILETRYRESLDPALPVVQSNIDNYVLHQSQFELGMLMGKLHLTPGVSRARFVAAEATSFKFDGRNMPDCQLDLIWENTQIHSAAKGWQNFSVASALHSENACHGTARWPTDLGKFYYNDRDQVTSIRCSQGEMRPSDAQGMLNSAVNR